MAEKLITKDQEIAHGGERVTHLYPNDCYFALPHALNKLVLDAGCGSGYGSAYLADHGAKFVEAVDVSKIAIKFDRKHFKREKLRYQVMGLEEIEHFPDQTFDLIYTSNVLEHVPEVIRFFTHTARILKQDGEIIIAVPPVVDEISRQNNIDKPYHLNIWTPRQWQSVIAEFYEEVQPYYHTFDKPGIVLNLENSPLETRITEKDFTFKKCHLDDFYKAAPLTVVFIGKKPKSIGRISPVQIGYVENSITRPSSKALVKQPSSSPFTKGMRAIKDEGIWISLKKLYLYGKRLLSQ